MILTVAGLKGGTGKTTSAVFLAAAAHHLGLEVTLLDTDSQGTALTWAEAWDQPWPTYAMPSRNVRREAARLDGPDRAIIIDTPPAGRAVIEAAIAVADLVVVPCRPTNADLLQVGEVLAVAADFDRPAVVLLTQTRLGTRSRNRARDSLIAGDIEVLPTDIPLREELALAGAHPVQPDRLHGYDQVLTDITTRLRSAS